MVEQAAERYAGLLRKFGRLATLDASLHAAVGAWPGDVRQVTRGKDIVRQREDEGSCSLLLSGVAARYKVTRPGKLQIVSFHYPGDMLDLHRYYGREDDTEITAVSAVDLAIVPLVAIRRTAAAHPALARAFSSDMLIDGAIGREWLLNVGQRSAIARLAHLLCETAIRLSTNGPENAASFDLPFTQGHLASATGLTSVHVNRTLRSLTDMGLLSYTLQRVTIHDLARLRAVGDFNPAYLGEFAEAPGVR